MAPSITSLLKAERRNGRGQLSRLVLFSQLSHLPKKEKLYGLCWYISLWLAGQNWGPTAIFIGKGAQESKDVVGVIITALDRKSCSPRGQQHVPWQESIFFRTQTPPSPVFFPLGRTSAFQARCGISVRGGGRTLVGGERNSSRHLFRWEPGIWESSREWADWLVNDWYLKQRRWKRNPQVGCCDEWLQTHWIKLCSFLWPVFLGCTWTCCWWCIGSRGSLTLLHSLSTALPSCNHH